MGMIRRVKRFGWIPDLPDQRDHLYSAPISALRQLPQSVDLRNECPPVYDQEALGSCTANAIAGAMQFSRIRSSFTPDFVPSRLFIYYNERVLMGEDYINQDSGAYLRDGMKTVSQDGVCPEEMWSYTISQFHQKPIERCYEKAREYQVINYSRISQSIGQMKACLATGYPFVFGFTVYESFESQQVTDTGEVPVPHDGEAVIGGHAVMAVGYDDARRVFIVRNSYGDGWGNNGYCYMPYSYLLDQDLSADFWTIRLVEE
jgi:C1A family cysteine protease